MMMMLVQIASADEVVTLPKGRWELTLVTTESMIDWSRKFTMRSTCVALGVEIMSTFPAVRDETLLGFVCETEDDDEPTS